MTGLIILGFLGIAIAFLIWITRAGARAGSRAWGNRWGGLGGGALTLLLVTSPLTWDTIPTLVAYKQACDNAKLIVRKEATQWRREHADEVAQIRPLQRSEPIVQGLPNGDTLIKINARFGKVVSEVREKYISIEHSRLVDFLTDETLAEAQVISTGKGKLRLHDRIDGLDDFKFWLSLDECASRNRQFWEVVSDYRKLGELK